ncbi:DUF3833 domain-containing protein [Alteromonas facilis]|uniref:DUF3833 domain-containing protein n=1 Tax=Alteromonas facilis TaxID=2048004 RepID=UPI000C286583|nr:DUF3833 domain-containing protein [Alteromonas facilis]
MFCLTNLRAFVLSMFTLLLVSACSSSIDGASYQSVSPSFDLKNFFDGKVRAWGIVQNRDGDVVQRFIVTIDGRVDDGTLILDETFEYGVGEGPLSRVWRIQQLSENTYVGSANDIAGDASGISYGNAFNFAYEMDLPVGDTQYRVAFDDWFWAFDEQTIMNRSYIRKFGLVMAEVTIFMQRQ